MTSNGERASSQVSQLTISDDEHTSCEVAWKLSDEKPTASQLLRYTVIRSGTNSQGNHYCCLDYGPSAINKNCYHYCNADGSYYSSNPDGSKYYRDRNGNEVYTDPNGERSIRSGWRKVSN